MRKFLRLFALFASMSLYAADAAKPPLTDCVEHSSTPPTLSPVPDIEAKILANLKRENPEWEHTAESFSLFRTQLGLNIKISGIGIRNLSALEEFDFDTVWLIDTAVRDTGFLKNSRSLRVLAVLNDKRNFHEIDLSGLRGKPLKSIALSNVRIVDPSCIRNIGFGILNLDHVENIDLAALSNLRELESFSAANMEIADKSFLRGSPKLRRVYFNNTGNGKSSSKCAGDAPTQTDARLAKYRAAAEKGDAASQFELGCRLGFGWGADGDNRREAEKWFRKAAAQGHITARGACLLFGFGVGKNPEEAEKLFRGEAEKGDAWAQLLLGRCRLGKLDVQGAVGWFRKSALQGNAVAQFKLAERYHFGGWGIAKDPAEADKWMKKSAEQGHTPALIVLESWEHMKHPLRDFSVRHGGIDVDKINRMDLAELKEYQKTVEEKYRAGEVGIEELNLIQSRIIELMHPRL